MVRSIPSQYYPAVTETLGKRGSSRPRFGRHHLYIKILNSDGITHELNAAFRGEVFCALAVLGIVVGLIAPQVALDIHLAHRSSSSGRLHNVHPRPAATDHVPQVGAKINRHAVKERA